jgi:multifunctional beta-oxidation protein
MKLKLLKAMQSQNYDSVENGQEIIAAAIQSFGRIDVLINNAGVLRDVSFKNMKDSDW